MSERDELADILMKDELIWGTAGQSGREYALSEADAILAAGYRKPRTITTAEELDVLEPDSVILCEGDRTGENGDQTLILAPAKPPTSGYQWRNHWITYFGAGMLDDFGKITVLWEPTP